MMSTDTQTLVILAVAFLMPAAGVVWVRYNTRKRVGFTCDVSWAEFEADHGEVEGKEASEVH